jgi:hypothetical protein
MIMTNISKNILEKLQELEDNSKTPFAWVEKLKYSTSKNTYTKTQFIHFDKGLWAWELNFFGGHTYVKTKVELEISKEFLSWLKRFKIMPKDQLITQLLKEDDDVLKFRCERDSADFQKTRNKIEKDLKRCFKNLK